MSISTLKCQGWGISSRVVRCTPSYIQTKGISDTPLPSKVVMTRRWEGCSSIVDPLLLCRQSVHATVPIEEERNTHSRPYRGSPGQTSRCWRDPPGPGRGCSSPGPWRRWSRQRQCRWPSGWWTSQSLQEVLVVMFPPASRVGTYLAGGSWQRCPRCS